MSRTRNIHSESKNLQLFVIYFNAKIDYAKHYYAYSEDCEDVPHPLGFQIVYIIL